MKKKQGKHCIKYMRDLCYICKWTYNDKKKKRDCVDYVRKFHKCQVHGDKINMPPVLLFNMVSPWPFSIWRIDVIGPINLKASNEHRFILVVIDYYTKWIKTCSYTKPPLFMQNHSCLSNNFQRVFCYKRAVAL